MIKPSLRRRAGPLAAVLIALLAVIDGASIGSAQSANESSLKAAYTLNFIKFTEWSELMTGAAIHVCVSSAGVMTEVMTNAMRGAIVAGHAVEVLPIGRGGALDECHVLFVSAREDRAAEALLAAAGSRHLLTVSDGGQPTKHGAIIELFTEGGRLRFAVNLDAMVQSGVRISSRLLSLAQDARGADAR